MFEMREVDEELEEKEREVAEEAMMQREIAERKVLRRRKVMNFNLKH